MIREVVNIGAATELLRWRMVGLVFWWRKTKVVKTMHDSDVTLP
jgi:hypothetical protein